MTSKENCLRCYYYAITNDEMVKELQHLMEIGSIVSSKDHQQNPWKYSNLDVRCCLDYIVKLIQVIKL